MRVTLEEPMLKRKPLLYTLKTYSQKLCIQWIGRGDMYIIICTS